MYGVNVRSCYLAVSYFSRYHLEEDQKFGDLKPGKMSDELRKALGLHKNEAPRHIYLMRKLGYPPGWLEEAKLTCSDLQMFDIDGNFLKTTTAKKQGLDACKIVDYPGFNVPFQKGVKDVGFAGSIFKDLNELIFRITRCTGFPRTLTASAKTP
jgi:hypothetical protein